MDAGLRTRSRPAPLPAAMVGGALLVGALSGYDPVLGPVLAVGVAFVALVLVDLLIGFAVMVVFSFLEAYSMFGSVSVAKLVGLLLVVAWLAAVTVGGRRHRNFITEQPALTYLLLLFLGWSAISIAWSPSRGDAVASASRYAINIALLPVAYAAVRDRRDAVRILAVLVAGACVAAVSGIITRPSGAAVDFTRSAGTVGDPNELAAALLVGLWVAAAFAVSRHVSPPRRLLAVVAVLLCLVGMLTSLSRGGLIGLGASLPIALVVAGRWRPRVLAATTALAVGAVTYFTAFASLPARERVLNVGGGGSGRLDLWTIAARMIADHPIRGIGSGQFQTASVHYLLQPGALERGDLILVKPKVAHNTYLNITAELGIVGGLLFLAIVAVCVGCAFAAVRRFRAAGDERMEILGRGLLIGLLGYLVTLLFISEDHSKLAWLLFALGPVMLAVARSPSGEDADDPAAPVARVPGRRRSGFR